LAKKSGRKRCTRRVFLKAGVAGAASLGVPVFIPGAARGADGAVAPSNRIALGFIGLGLEGKLKDLRGALLQPDVQVAALCDVHRKRLEGAHLAIQTYPREPNPKAYRDCFVTTDWRELVARDDIDAVVIATPDHWHVLPALAAAESGKDVFLEKPVSLTVREGRALSDTMRRYARVFQTASENRANAYFVRACELVRNGRIGKLHTIRTTIYRGFGRGNFDQSPAPLPAPIPVPADFDYDMWLGPAPEAPYDPRRCHSTFRYIFDYAGGNLTDWGAHINDIAQWGNDTEHSGPISVEGAGVFPKDGLFNTAIDWSLTYEYANGVRFLCESGNSLQVRFEGETGWIEASFGSIEMNPDSLRNEVIGPRETRLRTCREGEMRDFLDCVKLRCETYAPAETGHRTATLGHIGNIALLLGRKLRWDPDRERFLDDDTANRMLSRPMRSPWRLQA